MLSPPPAFWQLVSPFAHSRCSIFVAHWCLVQVKEQVAFAGPDSVVSGSRPKLAVPDPAATKWEVGVVGLCICIAEVVAERLRRGAGEDEVTFLTVVFVHADS
jgi:hypothetical protein